MPQEGGVAREHPPTLVFINQLRQKIGVVYGNDEVTAGGHALKYYSSVRLEVRRQVPKVSTSVTDSRRASVLAGCFFLRTTRRCDIESTDAIS